MGKETVDREESTKTERENLSGGKSTLNLEENVKISEGQTFNFFYTVT